MRSRSQRNVIAGIVDSGPAPGIAHAAARAFHCEGSGVAVRAAGLDPLGHGTLTHQLIHSSAPRASLIIAQVFLDSLLVPPRAVAAALDWLIASGARLVNLSLATEVDSPALRESCRRAIRAGRLLVASVPARGPQVFPAGYDGVIRVTGDARCGPQQFSAPADGRVDFGACPLHERPCTPGSPRSGGSSIATARITGALANLLLQGCGTRSAVSVLAARCAFRGPQGPLRASSRSAHVPDRIERQ